ncbi:hypothetical protein HD554DRAFT_976976 [Boletus coccyginus]|nr:hypothetical protein HD554DRAFT_976976 [Boletus coccyginus]
MASTSAQVADEATESSLSERLSRDERIQRALEILRVGRISVLGFMIKIFNPHEPAYAAHRDRLYTLPRAQTTGKLARFLDLLYDDKHDRGANHAMMEPHAVKLVTEKVYQEMDTAKVALRQPIDLITPESLRSWSLDSLMDSVVEVSFLDALSYPPDCIANTNCGGEQQVQNELYSR